MSRRRRAQSQRLDKLLPWLVSTTFHLGLALIVAFVVYLSNNMLSAASDAHPIIVPNSFEDPAYADHAGTAAPGDGADPLHQNGLKDIARSEGWNQSSAPSVASLMSGANDAVGIFAGSGAALTPGQTRDAAQAYGTPGAGAAIAPHSTFYGTGGNAIRIVYILDHSGSMLDNFDFLKQETVSSINKLAANQFFAVLLVSDHVTSVGPAQLQRALPDAKKDFANLLKNEVAEGANDGLLDPFEQAFKKAFAMDPQLIYFLTDGKFGEGLIARVNAMNPDKRVHINTYAFVTEEPEYKGQLQQLANANGGTYKFIPQSDVGK